MVMWEAKGLESSAGSGIHPGPVWLMKQEEYTFVGLATGFATEL